MGFHLPVVNPCRATLTLDGVGVQTCMKKPDHIESSDASRRAHHDPETGARWQSRPDDPDPLAGFVSFEARQEF